MATPNTYGKTSLTFGVPTLTGYVVQGFNTTAKTAVVAEVFDETGKRVHVRYDDLTSEATFEAIIQGATLPVPGGTVTVNAVEYEVISVDIKRSNKGFNEVSIKCKTSEGITLT